MGEKSIKQLNWYIFSDQAKWVENQAKDGKSKAEIYRRILDFGVENNLGCTLHELKGRDAPLQKEYINVTIDHYSWLFNTFKNKKRAEGFRKLVDYYIQQQKEGIYQ